MKLHLTARRLHGPDQQGARPGDGAGRVHRRHADRARCRRAAGRRARGHVAARPRPLLRGRLPGARRPRRPDRHRADRRASTGSRSTTTPTSHARGRWRAAPDADGRDAARDRHPAGRRRGARRRCSPTGGSRAAATSPSRSAPSSARSSPPRCARSSRTREFFTVEGGTLEAARDLAEQLREGSFDALVGIGGGRTLDVAKYAATLTGLPMVAVATNLAHDGIASPVSSLVHDGHKGSYGVQMPMAIVVDLDYVRRSEPHMRRSGIGDAVSNLSAIADWRLAEEARGEPVDGVAVTFAHTAAAAVLHREDGIDDDAFLVALAESLVLSGLAMATAGSSRPCSGGEHEILHAVDLLFPEQRPEPRRAGRSGQPVHELPARRRGTGGADRRLPHASRPAPHAARARPRRGPVRAGRAARAQHAP